MSAAAKPNGNPVNPPIPNIGKKPRANNIGVLNLIEPPHNDKSRAVRITTDGIEIIMVVV